MNAQRLDGGTPLHYATAFASGSSSRDFALALLQRGASVNLAHTTTFQTPLHVACQHQRPGVDAVVDLLLRWAADEKAVGGDGRTALDLLELDIHGDRAAIARSSASPGSGWREQRCLMVCVEEVSRARALSVRARQDRAWRRRCLTVILRWRKRSSTGCARRATGRGYGPACMPAAETMVLTGTASYRVLRGACAATELEATRVATLNTAAPERDPLSLESDRERSICERAGGRSIDEGHLGRVIGTVVGIASEELFRAIVGFL